jgi:cyclopropane fatty-acyl-phospholipid synthase-like methyltransferase
MLHLQPTISVLDIGFGPGSGVAEAAKTARFVAGIDHSELMFHQASNLNARYIRDRRLELQRGSVEHRYRFGQIRWRRCRRFDRY